MRNLFIYLCDTLFPPRENARYVRTLTQEHIAHAYIPKNISHGEVLSSFKNISIRTLVHEAKFHNNIHAQKLLAHLFDIHMHSRIHDIDLIIPIPLSHTRYRVRGYNQIHEILRYSTYVQKIPTLSILKRIRDTTPQTSLTREKRLTNVLDAFIVTKPHMIHGKKILLVDDVMTTGATLSAAKATLLPHSPTSITCLALAH
jgi:competence protein ComFC